MNSTLTERVLHVMKTNGVGSVYVTTDGNIFLPNKKNLADFHAKTNKVKVSLVKVEDLDEIKIDDENNDIIENSIENNIETNVENNVEQTTVTDKKQK